IMCRGDVAMVTYDWAEGSKNPFLNFIVLHQCRNFEKLLDWVDVISHTLTLLIRTSGT
ncbi:hypothetical protein EDD22DRAFT_774884, partial [Suillus occidentalis]